MMMNLNEKIEALGLESNQYHQVRAQTLQKQVDEPSSRNYHSAIIHKNSLYIYGGIPVSPHTDPFKEQSILYRYNIQAKIWSTVQTHFLSNVSFSYIHAHSTIINNNMMYLFGGKNYKDNAYIAGLWCLNLESSNWKRQ